MLHLALDPDGPTQLTCPDGLVIPWRPILSAGLGDGWWRGEEISPERLANWPEAEMAGPGPAGALWMPCDDGCVDGLWEMPEGDLTVCVNCRGTGEVPYAFIGIDFTYGVIPTE